MKYSEIQTTGEDKMCFEKEMSELLYEQILFTENIYARLPMGVEIYDREGILRSINDYALRMYGVADRSSVVGKVNLFNSPYVDDILRKRIKSGEDIVLEFEYDFDRINADAYFSSNHQDTMIYEVKVISIRNKKEAIVGHILIANDVTSTKEVEYRTEENKKNLEMAMEAANMSSWVYNVSKQVFGSLHGEAIVQDGMTLEELQEFIHPQDHVLLVELFTRLINKEIQQGFITIRAFNKQEQEYRHYESRMRLSSEHLGKLQIIGTQLDVTEKIQMTKKTRDLLAKRELAMKVSDIVHWDFHVRSRKIESYNDPVNDYVSDKLVSIDEYLEVIHPEDRSSVNDAIQSMLSGKKININFSCRLQTKYDTSWQYCNVTGVPFEYDECGEVIQYTGFRQNISGLHH